jgi:hypothetical protein
MGDVGGEVNGAGVAARKGPGKTGIMMRQEIPGPGQEQALPVETREKRIARLAPAHAKRDEMAGGFTAGRDWNAFHSIDSREARDQVVIDQAPLRGTDFKMGKFGGEALHA